MKNYDISHIKYTCYRYNRKSLSDRPLQPIGIDTEATTTGQCFMYATSKGDVFNRQEYPTFLFNRRYRGKTFVAYNLKYDMGAFVQHLPSERLKVLWKKGKVEYQGYKYRAVANKEFTIRKGSHAVHFYDMYNFYKMSLDAAARLYLGKGKDGIETVNFTDAYIIKNWSVIAQYCINDASLCQELAELLLQRFRAFGVNARKLYSVAYISYQYFRTHTAYPTVKRYWDKHREVLDYAMKSYNGGKFEVTEKGSGYFFEYDISSAYPYEISKLINISHARVVKSNTYRKDAAYAFIHCKMKIPVKVHSPTVVKRGIVNTYPCGNVERVITKTEYEYFLKNDVDITHLDGYYLHIDYRDYPFKKEVQRLYKLKQQYKQDKNELDYHTVKIFLNSLYGKFVQLIDKGEYIHAGSNWNPIYGAIITANCRCRMSEMQNTYSSCIAVHTDSLITKKQIEVDTSGELGRFNYETEGEGLILGSGVYQVGTKSRFRGFNLSTPLMEIIDRRKKTLTISDVRPYTWREVTFRDMPGDFINRFDEQVKKIDINFDCKRLWIQDWSSFKEVFKRNVVSLPLVCAAALFR